MEEKRSIFITGAASGIGRETALLFGKKGWFVGIVDVNEEGLKTLQSEIGEGNCFSKVMDVRNPESVQTALAGFAEKTGGQMDAIFNNAGTSARGVALEDLPFEQWKTVVDTNLTGTFLCIQEAFRIMKNQNPRGGRVINNGSVSAHVPRTNSIPYTATKHGITGLTKSASLDGRKYDIACCQIDIGNAVHEVNKERFAQGRLQPNGAMMVEPSFDVREVANAVLYMASLPLDTNVQFMTFMATKMPYIGRG